MTARTLALTLALIIGAVGILTWVQSRETDQRRFPYAGPLSLAQACQGLGERDRIYSLTGRLFFEGDLGSAQRLQPVSLIDTALENTAQTLLPRDQSSGISWPPTGFDLSEVSFISQSGAKRPLDPIEPPEGFDRNFHASEVFDILFRPNGSSVPCQVETIAFDVVGQLTIDF